MTYYDHRNSITTAYANNVANEYTSIADLAVLHDTAGNLSHQIVEIDGGTTKAYEYDYDHDNRLLSVDYEETGQSDVRVASYAYDAMGRLISSQMRFDSDSDGDTETLKYYYDGLNAIAEVSENDTMQRRYVHGTTYIDERAIMISGDPTVTQPLQPLPLPFGASVGLDKLPLRTADLFALNHLTIGEQAGRLGIAQKIVATWDGLSLSDHLQG